MKRHSLPIVLAQRRRQTAAPLGTCSRSQAVCPSHHCGAGCAGMRRRSLRRRPTTRRSSRPSGTSTLISDRRLARCEAWLNRWSNARRPLSRKSKSSLARTTTFAPKSRPFRRGWSNWSSARLDHPPAPPPRPQEGHRLATLGLATPRSCTSTRRAWWADRRSKRLSVRCHPEQRLVACTALVGWFALRGARRRGCNACGRDRQADHRLSLRGGEGNWRESAGGRTIRRLDEALHRAGPPTSRERSSSNDQEAGASAREAAPGP